MTNCPTCGRPVPEGQRFCGNCGTDVQAANAYRTAQNPGTPSAPPVASTGSFGYDQPAYDYVMPGGRRPSTMVLLLLVAGLALMCLCCGLVLGAAGVYLLEPLPPQTPPTPTPESLNLLRALFQI